MSKGIKFPFERTEEGGLFASNKTTTENVKSNLIVLLTTKRGQRPMQGDFFSPIYDHIHDQGDEILADRLKEKIREKIEKFMENVNLKDINIEKDDQRNMFDISITYSIVNISVDDELGITLPIE